MEEKKRVARLQKRSRSALERAIDRYTPYVGVTVWRVLGGSASREDLEEVVSDVFLSLWLHAGELDADQGLRPWLGTVARNRAIDRLRARPAPLPLSEADAAPGPSPEEAACDRDQAEQLWRAVEALGEPDTTLFLRYYYYGDKLGDIAAALGLKLPAARARLSRGRKKLKLLLTEGGDALWTQG